MIDEIAKLWLKSHYGFDVEDTAEGLVKQFLARQTDENYPHSDLRLCGNSTGMKIERLEWVSCTRRGAMVMDSTRFPATIVTVDCGTSEDFTEVQNWARTHDVSYSHVQVRQRNNNDSEFSRNTFVYADKIIDLL